MGWEIPSRRECYTAPAGTSKNLFFGLGHAETSNIPAVCYTRNLQFSPQCAHLPTWCVVFGSDPLDFVGRVSGFSVLSIDEPALVLWLSSAIGGPSGVRKALRMFFRGPELLSSSRRLLAAVLAVESTKRVPSWSIAILCPDSLSRA